MAIAELPPRFPLFFLDKIGKVLGMKGGSVDHTPTDVPDEFNKQVGSTQSAGNALSNRLAGQGGKLVGQGFGQLGDILGREGRLDPTLMNFQLSDIAKGTNSMQDAARASGAASGFQAGSGVDQAVQAAIGAGGADRRQGLIAEEARNQDARQKEGLQLLLQMVMNPQMQMSQQATQLVMSLLGVKAGDAGLATQVDVGNAAASDAFIGQLLSSAGSAAGAKGGK